jgi:hypothetical protein
MRPVGPSGIVGNRRRPSPEALRRPMLDRVGDPTSPDCAQPVSQGSPFGMRRECVRQEQFSDVIGARALVRKQASRATLTRP